MDPPLPAVEVRESMLDTVFADLSGDSGGRPSSPATGGRRACSPAPTSSSTWPTAERLTGRTPGHVRGAARDMARSVST